jgi:hypothetical protein
MVVFIEISSDQALPVRWTEYYIGIEKFLEKLKALSMMQSVCILHRTYHGRAQRCQNFSLESVLHLSSTITSGFEYLGCTLAMSSPAVTGSYERLRDQSFAANIASMFCKTYLGYQK